MSVGEVFEQCLRELECVKRNYGNIDAEIKCVKTPPQVCASVGILNDPELYEECIEHAPYATCEHALIETCYHWCPPNDAKCFENCIKGNFGYGRLKVKRADRTISV